MSGEGVRFGEFHLLRRLGAGGMAEVFLALRVGPEGFEKLLVVKRLLPHLARSPHFTKILLREARYSALIDHPNFVHVSSFGVIDDSYYLAMEYVDGLTIQELLGVVGSLKPGVAARIAIDMLDALHAIHTARYLDGRELHLVHRDVTPGNVMVTGSGTVKVLDLGIAVPSHEIAPRRAGTRRYMSPEQSRGETLDARSDLYCVGLLLCLMLSGRHPFDKDELADTLDETHPFLRGIIVDLLHEEREGRPSRAREVQERLEEFAVTRGREGTRAHLSEIAGKIAEARPRPSPRLETVSCLLSEVFPEDPRFEGSGLQPPLEPPEPPEPPDGLPACEVAPREADDITAIGSYPEPPAPLTRPRQGPKDTVEDERPPEIEELLDTIELSESSAREVLRSEVWPMPLELALPAPLESLSSAAPTAVGSAPAPADPTRLTPPSPDVCSELPQVAPRETSSGIRAAFAFSVLAVVLVVVSVITLSVRSSSEASGPREVESRGPGTAAAPKRGERRGITVEPRSPATPSRP